MRCSLRNRAVVLAGAGWSAVGLTAVVAAAWTAGLAADPVRMLPLTAAEAVAQKSVLDAEEEEEEPLPAKGPGKADVPDQPEEPDPLADDPLFHLQDEEEERPLRGGRSGPRPRSLDIPESDPGRITLSEEEQVYDLVTWVRSPGTRRRIRVSYCPHHSEFELSPESEFKLRLYSRTGEGKGTIPLKGKQIAGVLYYERRIGDLAAGSVGLASLQELARVGTVVDLSDRSAGGDRAEGLLRTALAEHDSAVQRGLRQGSDWNRECRQPLLRALVNVQLGQADALIGQQRYQQAEIECDRLGAEIHPDHPQFADLRRRVEEIFRARAKPAYDRGDYALVRELLDQLAGRYGGQLGSTAKGVQDTLMRIAAQRRLEAEKLIRELNELKDPASKEARDRQRRALELLNQAADVWPTLPGLHELRYRMDKEHPVLRCAYAELPGTLSPLDVHTPAERHAVSLIYESLVRWVDDRRSGSHHQQQLAKGRPIPLERGRAFHLPECVWSDSDSGRIFCRVSDVYRTFQLLKNSQRPGYSPAWSRLVDGVYDFRQPGPFVFEIHLARDHWQPLSLMGARILPAHHLPAADSREQLIASLSRLGERPVGTGPYRLAEREADVLRFTANPYYRHRDQGLPRIQEIVFERRPPNEAKELMLQGKIHLIYDVRMRHVVELREGGVYVLPLRTPSVWFLAPNYRRGSLANRDLRLAITHAIDRDAILDQQFRRGGNRQDHVVLTGPYPADSWACNHRLDRLIPTDATEKEAEKRMARACAQRALKGRRISLRLAYPQGNPEVQEACTQIKSQVEGTIEGITMVLEAIEPGRFHDRIVNDHDFDLAYWRHDYESPTFWLEPLLDQDLAAQRPGGPNFMGYTQDQVVAGLFRKLNMHKHFPDIQGLTHEIHEHVARNAVVIPLWQLDTYVALSPRLRLKDARGNVVERNRLDLFGNLDLLADARCWELAARGSR